MPSNLESISTAVIGKDATARLLKVLTIPAPLRDEDSADVSRAVVAQALNMVLFEDLLARVPAARDYIDDCLRDGIAVKHDHGAVRTVALQGMGALPIGEQALLRVLRPLGYALNGTYPLDRLKMIGRSYAQQDYPEDIAQFFISELFPDRFSREFQAAVARVTATSKDPLTARAALLLPRLEKSGHLSIDEGSDLVRDLASVFARQHSTPALADYEQLLQESPEMAWIATEGNAFNHATDRVPDVEKLTDEQKRLGRPMKERVEVSATGRVRQTAYRAAIVTRDFVAADGATTQLEVPGSFMEFITREPLPGDADNPRLDLSLDSSNAQPIFKMTAQQ